MRKTIIETISILSFLLSASMAGGGYFAYRYFSSDGFKTRVMNEVMQNVKTLIPGQINKQIPKFTQPATPTKSKSPINL